MIIQNNNIGLCQSPQLSLKNVFTVTPNKKNTTSIICNVDIDDSLPYSPSQPVFSTPLLGVLNSCAETPVSPDESLTDEDIPMSELPDSKSSICCVEEVKNHQDLSSTKSSRHYSARKHSSKKQKVVTETPAEKEQREKQETSSFFKICKSLASRLANAVRRTPDNSLNQSEGLESHDSVSENQIQCMDLVIIEEDKKTDEIDGDNLQKVGIKEVEKCKEEANIDIHTTAIECKGHDKKVKEKSVDSLDDSDLVCIKDSINISQYPQIDINMNNASCLEKNSSSVTISITQDSVSKGSAKENEKLEKPPSLQIDNRVESVELQDCRKKCTGSKMTKSKRRSADTQTLQNIHLEIEHGSKDLNMQSTKEEKLREKKSRRSADPILLREKPVKLVETEDKVRVEKDLKNDGAEVYLNKSNNEPSKRKRGRPPKRKSLGLSLLSFSENSNETEKVADQSSTGASDTTSSKSIHSEFAMKSELTGRAKKSQTRNLRNELINCEIDHPVRVEREDNDKSEGDKELQNELGEYSTELTNNGILFNYRHCADFDKIQEFLSLDTDPIVLPKKRGRGKGKRRSTDAIALAENTCLSEDSQEEGLNARPRRTTRIKRRSIEIYQAGSSDGCASESPSESIDSMDENNSPVTSDGSVSVKRKTAGKRKVKEENIEDIYRNKNFKRPNERIWETIYESPSESKNPDQLLSKKRFKRSIAFETTMPAKLKKRSKKAADNGWDSRKRKKQQLSDEFVIEKIAKIDELLNS